VNSSRLDAITSGWEAAHCPLNLRVGPGKAGLYAGGADETTRFKPGARVTGFEIMP
jgi:hypothetical protein